jgi:hypothetical protein
MTTALAVVPSYEEQAIDFHGDQITSIQDENGDVWVPLRRLCNFLGLHLDTQRKKIKNDPKFDHTLMRIVDSNSRNRETFCLKLDQLQGWLFTINANKIRADLRDKLHLYQQECFKVLNEYWTKGVVVNPRIILDDQTRDEIVSLVIEIVVPKILALVGTVTRLLTPKEQAQKEFEKDVLMLEEMAKKRPTLEETINHHLETLLDQYYGIVQPEEESELIRGVTPLTETCLKKLYAGEKWCLDKLMLYFPKEIPNRAALKQLISKYDLPPLKAQSSIRSRKLQMEVAKEWRIRRWKKKNTTIDDLVDYFNRPKKAIQDAIDKIESEIAQVFKDNEVDWFDKYIDDRSIFITTQKFYTRESKEWRNKRNCFLEVYDRCFDCGLQSPTALQCHHENYRRHGRELPDDLVVLCDKCHGVRHPDKK